MEQASTTSVATWTEVLSHREPDQIPAIAARFDDAGVSIDLVRSVLADSGAALFAALEAGGEGWADRYGGLFAVALLAGEVAAQSAYLVSRASTVRSVAVDALLEDFSAVFVAKSLGVSRQKVYEIGRNGARAREARV